MSEGMKFDDEKPRYDLLPMESIDQVAKVLTFGAKKYAPENWRKVEDADRRYLAAAMRHISAHMQGEEQDEETGLPHIAHAATCLLFILGEKTEPFDRNEEVIKRMLDDGPRYKL